MDLGKLWRDHAAAFHHNRRKMQEEQAKKTLVLTTDVKSDMDTTGDVKTPRALALPADKPPEVVGTMVEVKDGKAVVSPAKPWPDLTIMIPTRSPTSPTLKSASPSPEPEYKTMSISDAEPTTKFKSSDEKEMPPAKRLKSDEIDSDWVMKPSDFDSEVKEEKH